MKFLGDWISSRRSGGKIYWKKGRFFWTGAGALCLFV